MKYRDHMNLGALIYLPFLSKAYAGMLPASLEFILPFFRVFRFGGSWVYGAAVYLFFSIGCCLPDIDMAWYPEGGHRIRSPLHNLTNILIVYAISVFLCMLPTPKTLALILMMVSALIFGCLAHLAGDIIQGGVGWGIRRKIKIGFTGFKWNIYSETAKGSAVSIFIALLTGALWWYILNRPACLGGFDSSYAIAASAIIWLYSVVACRSYAKYLSNAMTAVILFAVAAAFIPEIIGL